MARLSTDVEPSRPVRPAPHLAGGSDLLPSIPRTDHTGAIVDLDLRIDIDRLTDRLAALAEIGAIDGTGGGPRRGGRR